MKKKYINDLDKITSIANSDLIIIQTDEGTRVTTYESLKNQLDIPEHVTIDSALSIDSTNPVQNKAVYASVNNIIDSLNTLIDNFNALQIPDAVFVDDTLSETSENAIANKTVYAKFEDINTAIGALNDTIAALEIPDAIDIDLAIDAASQNPVANSAIANELESLSNALSSLQTEVDNFVIPDPVTIDTELNGSSMNPIANAVVQSAINNIQTVVQDLQGIVDNLDIPDHVTIDSELDEESTNPVQNRVVDTKFKEIEQSIASLQTNIDNLDIPDGVTVDAALDDESTNPVQNKVVNTAITSINTNMENINNTLTRLNNGSESVGIANSSYFLRNTGFKEDAKPIFTDENNYNGRLTYSYGNDNTANSPTGRFMEFIDLGWFNKELHGVLGFDITTNELYSTNMMEGTWSDWAKYITDKNINSYIDKTKIEGIQHVSNDKMFDHPYANPGQIVAEYPIGLSYKYTITTAVNDMPKSDIIYNLLHMTSKSGNSYYSSIIGIGNDSTMYFRTVMNNELRSWQKVITSSNINEYITIGARLEKLSDDTYYSINPPLENGDTEGSALAHYLRCPTGGGFISYKAGSISSTAYGEIGNEQYPFNTGHIRTLNSTIIDTYRVNTSKVQFSDYVSIILGSGYYSKGLELCVGDDCGNCSFLINSSDDNNDIYFLPYNRVGSARAHLGNSTTDYRFNNIYLKNSPDVSSDKREKKEISYIGQHSNYNDTSFTDDQLVDFVDSLSSVIYKRKEDDNKIHHGLIAQDVEEVLNRLGISHAVLSKVLTEDGKDYTYGLCYEELIADIIRYTQILKKEKEDLKTEIKDLRKELNEIKELLNK